MNELTHLDLCSGIFGFGLAARWAGFSTVAVAEIDPYCKAEVLPQVAPGIPNLGDIRRAGFSELQGVSLVTAGYPCQPFSFAGERRGETDDRHLWPEVRRCLKECRPAWFVGENVIGHVSLGLDAVLSDLEADGYPARAFIVPACAVGAWHRRDRVWIVAHATGQHEHARDLLGTGGSRGGLRQSGGFPSLDLDSIGKPEIPGWEREPGLVRLVHGLPHRTHRLQASGNAIVPQVAYPILRAIYLIETA